MIVSAATIFYLSCAALLPAEGELVSTHDPFDGADQVLHLSFEPPEDQDHDRQPDDWTRRRGPQFPSYVDARIDRQQSHDGRQSLRFDVNGGRVILYSPPQRIDPWHSYVFQGVIRTQMLRHDAALISVSFLDHKRQRIQRFLSRPVSGTHRDWVRVRVGPMEPKPDVRFVVIGCHLVQRQKMDIHGTVWFDDLWLGRLPQLKLLSNFDVHFKRPDVPIVVTSNVSGLDSGREYRLDLKLLDNSGQVIASTSRPLQEDPNALPPDTRDDAAPRERPPEVWNIDPLDYGYYQIRSTLLRDQTVILDQQTSLVVMDLVEPRARGEFGWSVGSHPEQMPIDELASVAAQTGINWLKYPLWRAADGADAEHSTAVAEMLEELDRRGITPVGLLNEPPAELREQFARDWTGISEIFTMPPSFWSASMDKVIARFSTTVRHWQLGDETDSSFVGMTRLGETLTYVKGSFDRIGRDTHIGVPWDWNSPLPPKRQLSRGFLSVGSRWDPREPETRLSPAELAERLEATATSGVERWVLLRPLPRSKHPTEERGADLVKRMVTAKIGGAEAIFAFHIFDEEFGLLNPNGSPTLLFLPWRSTALALQDAEYLGAFQMPSQSVNHVFARDGEAMVIVWNEEPAVEELYLGERATAIDIWGRQHRLPKSADGAGQRIDVGPTPLIIRGCSEPVARWRLAVNFERGRLRSETAEQPEAIQGINTFPQGVSGQVSLTLPDEWKVDRNTWNMTVAAGEAFHLPMLLTLPANASLGLDRLSMEFEISADRPYKFRVFRPYQVGLGDVALQVADFRDEDGRLRIEQIITNQTSPPEILNFRCSLFIPGHKRQKKLVVKLGQGEDHQFYFAPNAESLRGKELWLRAEQIQGPRVLNFKWVVGQTWDQAPTP